MKHTAELFVSAIIVLGVFFPALAANLKDSVKVETESAQLHAGMESGMYMCAAQHLHIRASVENQADVPLGRIMVAGRVFDGDGGVMGTATASTRQTRLAPGEKAAVDLEFLTIIGAMIEDMERHEIAVVEAPTQ